MHSHESEALHIETVCESEAQGLPLPSYATHGSAGMDLYAAIPSDQPITLEPGRRALVTTGLRIAIPLGYEAQVRPRSGLAVKYGISVVNAPGTIDSDYRGVIQVILINWGETPFVVQRGDRIAQLVIAPVVRARLNVVEVLDSTERGIGGFGSTGVSS